eukprot:5471397-Prymnesium_polylepis.5
MAFLRALALLLIGSCAVSHCNASGGSFTTIGSSLVSFQFSKYRGAVTTTSGQVIFAPPMQIMSAFLTL